MKNNQRSEEESTLELVEFTPENCLSEHGKNSAPKISLNCKSGVVSLNKALCELAGIKIEDSPKVLFHQNRKDQESWYLEVGVKSGFELREVKAGKSLAFNNVALVKKIFESIKYSENSGSVKVSNTKLTSGDKILYFIITSSLKEKK